MTPRTKLSKVIAGEALIFSDQDLDEIGDNLPGDVISIPNPKQCGTLDKYIVAKLSHPVIRQFRNKHL